MNDAERFMQKVEMVPEAGCWIWMGALETRGYGGFYDLQRRRLRRAHRVSYELFVGPIPDGLYICHRCDVPLCVNPAHLFAGTQLDNLSDANRKGRTYKGGAYVPHLARRTHCKRGHLLSGNNLGTPVGTHKRICLACKRLKWKLTESAQRAARHAAIRALPLPEPPK